MKQLEVVAVNMMNKEYFENCHIKKFISIPPNDLKEKALLPFALSVFRVKARKMYRRVRIEGYDCSGTKDLHRQ